MPDVVRVGTEPLAVVDLSIRQGADTTWSLSYTATDTGGAPLTVDFTGWTARAQLRTRAGGDLWINLTSGAGIALSHTSTTLTLVCTIGHAVTEGAAWNNRARGVWDLELVRADGWVIPLAAGTVQVSHDITRAVTP